MARIYLFAKYPKIIKVYLGEAHIDYGYNPIPRRGRRPRRPECNEHPLRYGKAISSMVYTSLPCEGREGWGVYVYEDANQGFVCFATFRLCGNTSAPSLYPPLKGGRGEPCFLREKGHFQWPTTVCSDSMQMENLRGSCCRLLHWNGYVSVRSLPYEGRVGWGVYAYEEAKM